MVPKTFQAVEKVVAGPVGVQKRPHNKAKTLRKRHFQPLRTAAEESAKEFFNTLVRFRNTLGRSTQIRTFPYQNRPESRPEIKAPKPTQSY